MACAALLCGYRSCGYRSCDYRSYGAMAQWGRNYGAELAQALGFKNGKTPCAATFYAATFYNNIADSLGLWNRQRVAFAVGCNLRLHHYRKTTPCISLL
jgi:hypothetical protein